MAILLLNQKEKIKRKGNPTFRIKEKPKEVRFPLPLDLSVHSGPPSHPTLSLPPWLCLSSPSIARLLALCSTGPTRQRLRPRVSATVARQRPSAPQPSPLPHANVAPPRNRRSDPFEVSMHTHFSPRLTSLVPAALARAALALAPSSPEPPPPSRSRPRFPTAKSPRCP